MELGGQKYKEGHRCLERHDGTQVVYDNDVICDSFGLKMNGWFHNMVWGTDFSSDPKMHKNSMLVEVGKCGDITD